MFDSFDFLGISRYAFGGDYVTQVFDRFLEEFAFRHIAIHLVFTEDFKDLADVLCMILVVSAINQDIIDVDNHTNIKKGFQDILDQGLESGGCIGESKRHDLILVMAISRAKCSFFDVILVDPNLVVSPSKVDFGEY